MKKILITGGAGYVGSVLTQQLLQKGYKVRVLDNLFHHQMSHIPFFSDKNYEFIRGDIREKEDVKKSLQGVDAIINLAAIVGAPQCRMKPKLAEEVNVLGVRNINQLRSGDQPLIYASTGSVYGALQEICTEESPVNPTSVYGKTKLTAEKDILEKGNSTALRFATAFGVSPRLRVDTLLINDFVYRACEEKEIIVYQADVRRTFIHIQDMARCFIYILENFGKANGEIFNAGSEKLNFTKKEIAEKIKERIPYYLYFAEIGEDADKRDYEVSYEKIKNLGFEIEVSLEEGIDELVRAFRALPEKLMRSQPL